MVEPMTLDQPTDIVARDVSAAVGDVMLFWGFLEAKMLETLDDEARGPSIFQRWLTTAQPSELVDQIKDVAAVRHLLAHGLCGLAARPKGGGEAHVLCRRLDGAVVPITIGELRETAQRLDLLRLSLDR
jgi:hypothetical protein